MNDFFMPFIIAPIIMFIVFIILIINFIIIFSRMKKVNNMSVDEKIEFAEKKIQKRLKDLSEKDLLIENTFYTKRFIPFISWGRKLGELYAIKDVDKPAATLEHLFSFNPFKGFNGIILVKTVNDTIVIILEQYKLRVKLNGKEIGEFDFKTKLYKTTNYSGKLQFPDVYVRSSYGRIGKTQTLYYLGDKLVGKSDIRNYLQQNMSFGKLRLIAEFSEDIPKEVKILFLAYIQADLFNNRLAESGQRHI